MGSNPSPPGDCGALELENQWGCQALFPDLVSLTLPGLSMASMKPGRTSEISLPVRITAPVLSSIHLITPHTPLPFPHTHSTRNLWPRQDNTEPIEASLEAKKLEEKHHPEKLPRILELASVFFKGLWQLPIITLTGCWEIL